MHGYRKKLRLARSFLARRLVHVNLQILYDCNFRCGICDFWKPEWRDRPRLSAADAATIGAKLATVGPQIISIGGGEPLLHPELPAIVRALAADHFPVMITNGSRVTPTLARELFAAGMVEISVSVDYAEAAKHDAQRGRTGAHATALAALETLQANRTRPDQRVHMMSVILEDNLADLVPLIEQCAAMGITHLVTLYSHSRGAKSVRRAPPELSQTLLDLKSRHRHFVPLRGYVARFSEAAEVGGVGACQAGRSLCNIDSAGEVTLCIDHLDTGVGNILTDDIATLIGRLRERQKANPCHACWTSCRGSIESIMRGPYRLRNLLDYHQMTRSVPLGRGF